MALNADKIESIQILRALAAGLVVIGHLIGAARGNPGLFGSYAAPHYGGGVGVDVFFLISGFIMVQASSRYFGSKAGSGTFFLKRLIRIVPLYWGVTFLAIALSFVGSGEIPSLRGVVSSLSFIPYASDPAKPDAAYPIVDLGWTLNYEMLFYLVFALFIPLGRDRCVIMVTVAMLALAGIGMFAQPEATAVRFWTQSIILEFVMGMHLAVLFSSGRLSFGVAPRVIMVAVAAAIYLFDPFYLLADAYALRAQTGATANDMLRVLGWGVPSALLLIGTISGPLPLGKYADRALVNLGDASYALYLLHPFAIMACLRAAGYAGYTGPAGMILFITGTFLVAAIGSMIAHKLVEKPVTRWLASLVSTILAARKRHASVPERPAEPSA